MKIKKFKISELFIINQGHQITDEEIYVSVGEIPIYTAGNIVKGYGSTSLVKMEELPCITYQTKGFSGIVSVQEELFDANNTAALILRDEFKGKVNLYYVAYLLKDIFLDYTTADSGVSYLNKDIVADINVSMPVDDNEISYNVQIEYVEQCKKISIIKRKVELIEKRLNDLKYFEFFPVSYKELKVFEIAILNKGSSKISEEMIYKNHEKNGVPVYSSATENGGLMGHVNKLTFQNFDKKGGKNELTWTTNGVYAGVVFYRESEYLYSEKCGRIVIRQEYSDKILPKYLCYILNQITYKYRTSESTNCKLDIIHMQEIPVKIPINEKGEIDVEAQKIVINQYERIEMMYKNIAVIRNKLYDIAG